jgi:hypothetical protein
MPQIIVTATAGEEQEQEHAVMLRERISASDFESERFAANLVERLGWAVVDATEAESQEPTPPRRERIITRAPDPEPESELEPVGSA